jgi:DNA-3-methyladenine glycosylase I
MKPEKAKPSCAWGVISPLMRAYHDAEWGVPVHDDRTLFEFLVLEGAQAGLSWETILRKRAAYRVAFDRFEIAAISDYDDRKTQALLADSGIVRNRLKIAAAIGNARAVLAVQRECGSLDGYLWSFVDGRPRTNDWRTLADVPARMPEAEAMSKDLVRRGFRFVGPTICYAFMQAVGMVNDHLVSCFRHAEISGLH